MEQRYATLFHNDKIANNLISINLNRKIWLKADYSTKFMYNMKIGCQYIMKNNLILQIEWKFNKSSWNKDLSIYYIKTVDPSTTVGINCIHLSFAVICEIKIFADFRLNNIWSLLRFG